LCLLLYHIFIQFASSNPNSKRKTATQVPVPVRRFFLEKKKKEKEEWMKKVCVVPLGIWQCPNGVWVPVPWHRSFWEQL
jgi:hypothetical protein